MSTTFTALIGALVDVLDDVNEATGGHMHVQRWGSAEAHLHPAAWLAMTASTTKDPDSCSVTDELPITLNFSVKPRPEGGSDLVDIETLVDAAVPLVDKAMRSPRDLGVQVAKRTGLAVTVERLGDAQTTVLTLPLHIDWTHHIPD